MNRRNQTPTAKFNARFFPQHIALLSVGENLMPMGYWTVISKEPFRFLICMQVGNHSLILLKKFKEAALHFMPWSERQRVVATGHHSGRDMHKAEKFGFRLIPAEKLEHTRLVAGADVTYELVIHRELMNLSREFALFAMDVVATHGELNPTQRQPIIYLSLDDFATLGEKWVYEK
jgi:flavin reductase (DIM6/NTAB) family NADH-FMN oxidoreductase RutF